MGIPHSQLAQWATDDVDMLLAYEAHERDFGPNGELLSEATDPGADPNDYTSGYRYVAHGPFINWAEKTRLDAIAEWKTHAGENPNLNGMFWTVEKVEA